MTHPFKPQGLPSLLPYLTVRYADEAIAFYRDVFQFQLKNSPEEQNNKIVHAEMALGDALIMMAPEGAWGSTKKAPKTSGNAPSTQFYIYVPDVDAHFKHAIAKGAEAISEPVDMFWGDRCAQLRDPDGYEWTFATKVSERDLSKAPLALS